MRTIYVCYSRRNADILTLLYINRTPAGFYPARTVTAVNQYILRGPVFPFAIMKFRLGIKPYIGDKKVFNQRRLSTKLNNFTRQHYSFLAIKAIFFTVKSSIVYWQHLGNFNFQAICKTLRIQIYRGAKSRAIQKMTFNIKKLLLRSDGHE